MLTWGFGTTSASCHLSHNGTTHTYFILMTFLEYLASDVTNNGPMLLFQRRIRPSCNLVVPLVENVEYLPADPELSHTHTHTHKSHYVKVSLGPHANAKCSCAWITDSSKKKKGVGAGLDWPTRVTTVRLVLIHSWWDRGCDP